MVKRTATLTREVIAGLIPHSGNMCLLDRVVAWDDLSIHCVSTRHRMSEHPLRQEGRIGALCGIEFAAQAMAVHGRLAGVIGERPRAGYLVSVRDVVCHFERLDQFDDLFIDATRLLGDNERVMYSFTINCDGRDIVTGRATVLLQTESRP